MSVVPPECTHERSVVSDMSHLGVMEEVTVCADCSHVLDRRPLRPKDVAGSDAELPPYEAEIQAAARIAKARELGIAGAPGVTGTTPCVSETGPVDPAGLEAAEDEEDEVVASRLRVCDNDPGPVDCAKHGGRIAECDTGPGRANLCQHGKWGRLGTFNRPCVCTKCHSVKPLR